MMKKILEDTQIKSIEQIQNTFPNSILMKPKEMAILEAPLQFPSTNRARHYKMLADRAEEVISELTFLFKYLPASYKNKIMDSDNFNNFVENFLNLNTMTQNLDDDTKNVTVKIASQLFVNSFAAIKGSLPSEFIRPIVNTATPLLKWLQAISKYGKRKSLSDIPELRIPNKAWTPYG